MSKVVLRNYKNKIHYVYEYKGTFRRSAKVNLTSTDIGKSGIKQSVINKHPIVIAKLNELNNYIENYFIEHKHYPSIDELKIAFDANLTKKIEKEEFENQNTILKLYSEFHAKKEHDFKKTSIASLRDFTSTQNSLIDYEMHFKTTIKLSNIDDAFVEKYGDFMRMKHQSSRLIKYITDGSLKESTLKKRYDCLFQFFRWLRDEKKVSISMPLRPKLKIQPVLKEYLSPDEIIKLSNFQEYQSIKLKHNTLDKVLMGKVKDVFIVMCHTGMRYSDVITFNKSHLYEGDNCRFIQKINQKTKIPIYIPVSDVAEKIMIKLNYNLKVCENATFNRAIKAICEQSGLFNYDVDTSTGKKKKHQVISSHTGRHSFVTNLISSPLRIPLSKIMGYTGHTQISTLTKYVHSQSAKSNSELNEVYKVEEYKNIV